MKIKELIKQLQAFENQNMIVLVSKDEEGNGFGELQDVCLASYRKEDYGYETGIPELTPELEKQGYGPEDVRGKGRCIVLWP